MSSPIHHAVYVIRNNDGYLLSLQDPYRQTLNWAVPYLEYKNADHFSQLWHIVRTPNDSSKFFIRSLSNGSVLNLEPDFTYGENNNGHYCSGWRNHGNTNQQWKFESRGEDKYVIKNVEYGTALELFNDKGTSWFGATSAHGGESQVWHLERRSRGGDEIKNLIHKHYMCRNINGQNFNVDGAYIVLPDEVRQSIWEKSSLKGARWRSEIFDCDDFAYVMKAEVAKWGRDNIYCDDIAILLGVHLGRNNKGEGHAFNWYITQALDQLKWFEPQDGTEDDDALGYYAEIMFF